MTDYETVYQPYRFVTDQKTTEDDGQAMFSTTDLLQEDVVASHFISRNDDVLHNSK